MRVDMRPQSAMVAHIPKTKTSQKCSTSNVQRQHSVGMPSRRMKTLDLHLRKDECFLWGAAKQNAAVEQSATTAPSGHMEILRPTAAKIIKCFKW